jgi:hypothetical protein
MGPYRLLSVVYLFYALLSLCLGRPLALIFWALRRLVYRSFR